MTIHCKLYIVNCELPIVNLVRLRTKMHKSRRAAFGIRPEILYLCTANEKAGFCKSAFFVPIPPKLALGKKKIALGKFKTPLLEVCFAIVPREVDPARRLPLPFNHF